MAETLVGGVELKRIAELLAKALIQSDLSDYNIAIDKAGEADTKKVALDELLAFAGGSGRICTGFSEMSSGVVTSDNLSLYIRLNSPVAKLINTFRSFIFASTTTNLITIKLYNADGTEIAGAEGTGSPAILTTLQNLDIALTTPVSLAEGVFYWVGIHQATGGGASFARNSGYGNIEWLKQEAASPLASSVPAGALVSGNRAVIELM